MILYECIIAFPYFVLIRSRTEPIGFASTIINATLGNYIGKRNGHSRRNSGNIPRQIKRAVIPKGCINIHKQRIQHSRNGTVNYSEHKTLFKLRSENSGYKPDYTPRKHLERCPWTLPKIKIRYYGGQRTRHKACLWAEIHRCYYNECRHRFYAGCPRKK